MGEGASYDILLLNLAGSQLICNSPGVDHDNSSLWTNGTSPPLEEHKEQVDSERILALLQVKLLPHLFTFAQ